MQNGQINVLPNQLNFDGERVQLVQLKAILKTQNLRASITKASRFVARKESVYLHRKASFVCSPHCRSVRHFHQAYNMRGNFVMDFLPAASCWLLLHGCNFDVFINSGLGDWHLTEFTCNVKFLSLAMIFRFRLLKEKVFLQAIPLCCL